ncbi:MAG: alpha/beta fold hydrolase [Candidatus Eremiobacteraeota bacterium]|nr:alpha/beta fold hydrolase [Candidatus Eremiobacteraeota bacterium]
MIETLQFETPDGATTGARVAGRSGPGLVFVHGVGSTAAIWDAQLRAFASDFRCAAIELRGNGALADPDPELITRAGFAVDVLAATRALGFERFTIVGCSLGGVVAFELWQRTPERIDAMVIVGSFAQYPKGEAYAASIIAALQETGDMRSFAKARATRLNLPPDRLEETIEQMACKSVPCYRASTQATWTGDYRTVLASIDVPVAVLCGERDTIAPVALSREIADGIAGARLSLVEGAGHVANADAPERFNALLREFLTVNAS